MTEAWVTVKGAAGRLGVSEVTIRRWVRRGFLLHYQPGRGFGIRIRLASVERMARQATEAKP